MRDGGYLPEGGAVFLDPAAGRMRETYEMKQILAAAAMVLVPGAALADDEIVTRGSEFTVAQTVDKLTAAIEEAGATIFAVVDHGAGAESVGEDIGASQLVVFGNPAIGTPAILDNRQAGLFLPLKVLVYQNEGGQVMVAYEDPEEMFDDLGNIDDDAEYIAKMSGALENFVTAASE